MIVVGLSPDEVDAGQDGGRDLLNSRKPLLRRFAEQAGLGLGSDLLGGPRGWVHHLAEAGLIQNLSDRVDDTTVS